MRESRAFYEDPKEAAQAISYLLEALENVQEQVQTLRQEVRLLERSTR